MELLPNVLAMAGMAVVAYMCSLQGLYRSALTLVACLVAGVVGFGLFGPVSSLFPRTDPQGVWYYAADAMMLWALFSLTFLGLRTLGERLLRNPPAFPSALERVGGAVLGLVTGYLCVGLCFVLLQMLPVSPDVLGAYSPMRLDGRTGEVNPADRLWLGWDRGVLGLYGYVLGGPLGAEDGGFLAAYGDLYPPAEMIEAAEARDAPPPDGAGERNADDFLYYHWYRRYLFVWWRKRAALGPVPPGVFASPDRPGLVMRRGQMGDFGNLVFRVVAVQRPKQLPEFPNVRLDHSQDLLVVTLDIRPVRGLESFPETVETGRLSLVGAGGRRYADPLVLGQASQEAGGEPSLLPGAGGAPAGRVHLESPEYHFQGGRVGRFLAKGMTLTFTAAGQGEQREVAFIVPSSVRTEDFRLECRPSPEPVP